MENISVQNPASEAPATNPEHPLYQPPVNVSQKNNNLFTLISLLVLLIVILVTVLLYFQNKKLASKDNIQTPTIAQNSPTPSTVNKTDAAKLKKYGVICKQFKSVELALQTPEIACGLNLSGQKLTSLPNGVEKLTNLNAINLSNNDFTTFPAALLELPNLYSIDLSNNGISSIPSEVFQNKSLQSINLAGNPIQNKETSTSSTSSAFHIIY